jgi:hypothetical protein
MMISESPGKPLRCWRRPDVLLLGLLLGIQVWAVGGTLTILYVLGTLVYLFLDFVGLPLDATRNGQSRRGALGYTLRWILVALMTVLPMILLTSFFVSQRLTLGTDAVARNVTLVDSALQIELATQMILAGRNPYAETFQGTAVELTPSVPGYDFNPAVFHFVYPPLSFLLPIPFYWLAQWGLGWFDLRLVWVPFFLIVTFMLMPRLVEDPARRLALLVLVLFNPAILLYAAQGQNEAIAFAWLVLLLVCLKRRWFKAALLALGVGCGIKQTIGFMVPFALVYLYQQQRPDRWFNWLIRNIGMVAAPLVLSLLPFAIWDLPALADDVFGYASGHGVSGFPIMGYGLGQLLLNLGVIRSPRSAFPFWVFQLIVGLPVLLMLLRWQWRTRRLASCTIGYSIFMLILFFFSRFFHDTYLIFGITLVAVGYLMDESALAQADAH